VKEDVVTKIEENIEMVWSCRKDGRRLTTEIYEKDLGGNARELDERFLTKLDKF
jgi:hypothetical protein